MSSPCRAMRDALHPLVDSELAVGWALELRLHAAACPACDRRLGSAQRLADALSRMGRHPAAPPAELPGRILASLPVQDRRRWRLLAAGSLAAGLCAASFTLVRFAGRLGASVADPAVSGIRAALGSAGEWLGRFDALFQVFYGLLDLPAGLGPVPSAPSLLPPLALIVTGLLGISAAVTLSAAPRPGSSRRHAC